MRSTSSLCRVSSAWVRLCPRAAHDARDYASAPWNLLEFPSRTETRPAAGFRCPAEATSLWPLPAASVLLQGSNSPEFRNIGTRFRAAWVHSFVSLGPSDQE